MAQPEAGHAGGPDAGRDAADRSEGPESSNDAERPETVAPADVVGSRAASPGAATPLSWSETVQVVPVVLRSGLQAGQRLVTWTVSSSMLVSDWTTSDPIGGIRHGIVSSLRAALGIDELEAELRRLTGHPTPAADTIPTPPEPASLPPGDAPDPEPPSLQERGRRLLAQSVALEDDEEHPAFGLVLEQVAPDEMRLLRVLVRDGPQAAVDVEAAGVLAGGGRVVARRITLLGEKAGCKHPDRLPVYLDNLERLGVVHVTGEALGDDEYEIVEAQPRVTEAREEASRGASRARLVRRRLALTDFGRAFCASCLPR